jgi:hypothetical protein
LETEELELSTTVLARYYYYGLSKCKYAKTTFGIVSKISSRRLGPCFPALSILLSGEQSTAAAITGKGTTKKIFTICNFVYVKNY